MVLDKRIIKTKNSIKNAFLNLVENTDINRITVSELAAKAMVNRSTFYLHYPDVRAVAEDIEKEIESRIGAVIDDFDITDVYSSTFVLFRKLTNRLDELPAMKNYIISSTNSEYIVGRIKCMFVEKTQKALIRKFPALSAEDTEYPLIYAASGIIDCYIKWVRTDGKKPGMEQLIRTVSGITEPIILKFSKS